MCVEKLIDVYFKNRNAFIVTVTSDKECRMSLESNSVTENSRDMDYHEL